MTFVFKIIALSAMFFAFTGFPQSMAAEERIIDNTEVTLIQDKFAEDFVTPTLENLSRLYWKLGVFDIDDNIAIDNYLKINECDIYTNFIEDEFEWAEIQNATRSLLKSKTGEFKDKFKFLIPIALGDYDMDRGGFDIIKDTGFPNLKRIEYLSSKDNKEICGDIRPVPDYERNILLMLKEPLDYEFIHMNEHVAQAFILRRQYEEQRKSERTQDRKYKRQAYIRLRMNIKEYQGNIKANLNNNNLAILYGELEGIDIFDDIDEKLLLASYSAEELKGLKTSSASE